MELPHCKYHSSVVYVPRSRFKLVVDNLVICEFVIYKE